MNNIVPDSVNDRINSLFKQVNTVNKTITNVTSNYISDSSDNSLVVKSNTFTINTDNSGILLGDKTNPDSMILYGTSDPTTIIATDVPNGSIYLTSNLSGTAYIKQNNIWNRILTEFTDITLNNLNISGEATIGNNLYVEKDVNIIGIMNVSGNVTIDGDMDITGSLTSGNLNTGDISGTTLVSSNITCSGSIISTDDITSSGKIIGNSLNVNSKLNIDTYGNLNTTGDINVSGNITGTIILNGTLTVSELNINSKTNIDSNGNIDTSGNINANGNINILGTINCDNDIITTGLLKSNTLNINNKLNIDSSGNLDTSGTIIAYDSITTNSSINANTLNINNKLFVSNTGTLNSSGSINVSGDVTIGGNFNIEGSLLVDSLNINQNIIIDSSGNINTSGYINASGNINNSGNIISTGSMTTNSLNVNSKTYISSTGNIDTSGNINSSGSINNLTLTSQSEGFSISGGTTSKTFTVNRTLNFSGTDNTTITFPSTSQTLIGTNDVQNFTNKTIQLIAGTTLQAPLQFTSGINLTNSSGGAIEYDGNNYYATSIDCSDTPIRKILPNMNYYRIDSDRATINTSDTIYTYDVFPSGTFIMDADAYYIVDWTLNWIINSNSDMRYDIVTSSAPQYIVIGGLNIAAPGTGVSMNYGTTTTTSFSNISLQGIGANTGTYCHTLRAYILNGSTNGTTIKLQIYTLNANVTLKRGSRIFITKMPNANFGNFS